MWVFWEFWWLFRGHDILCHVWKISGRPTSLRGLQVPLGPAQRHWGLGVGRSLRVRMPSASSSCICHLPLLLASHQENSSAKLPSELWSVEPPASLTSWHLHLWPQNSMSTMKSLTPLLHYLWILIMSSVAHNTIYSYIFGLKMSQLSIICLSQ